MDEGVDFVLPIEYCISNSIPMAELSPLMFEEVNLHGEG